MRQHKMTNHKAEMMTATNGSNQAAQGSPSLKELPGPSVATTIPAAVMTSMAQIVKTTSSQTSKSGVNSVAPLQFNVPHQQQNTLQMSQNSSSIPVLSSGAIDVTTTNGVQVKELNSVLANYVKTKALKTNHNQSPSQSTSQSETQIILPFTPPSSSTTMANPVVTMSAPAKTIKAPMLQRQLMSPLKPLSNGLNKDLANAGLPLSSSAE